MKLGTNEVRCHDNNCCNCNTCLRYLGRNDGTEGDWIFHHDSCFSEYKQARNGPHLIHKTQEEMKEERKNGCVMYLKDHNA